MTALNGATVLVTEAKITGMAIDPIVDGRSAESWIQVDALGLLSQPSVPGADV